MAPWIFYALLSALFAALVAILAKIGIRDIDTTVATGIRAVAMAVFLSGAIIVLGKTKLAANINGTALVFIVLSGVAGALSWLFYFLSLRSGPASGVAALDRLSVVFVLILALLFLGERFSWRAAMGAALLTGGAILMAWR